MRKAFCLIAVVAVLAAVVACAAPARVPAPEVVEKEVMVERILAEDEMAGLRAPAAPPGPTPVGIWRPSKSA